MTKFILTLLLICGSYSPSLYAPEDDPAEMQGEDVVEPNEEEKLHSSRLGIQKLKTHW